MTDTNQPASAPMPPVAPGPDASAVSAKEVEEGKVFAILSYIIPFFVLVPLIQRNNAFALYHARQCLLLWIIGVVGSTALTFSCVLIFLTPFLSLAILVLAILGLINAAKGEMKPVPLIGKFAEDWFKGIQKA